MLVIKGDLKVLSNYSIIQGVYMYLNSGLNELRKLPIKDGKREITFVGEATLSGYKLKFIENVKTKVITVILK